MFVQAVQVIQQLAVTETDLMKRKRRLTERRDSFLCSIAPAAGPSTDLQTGLYSTSGVKRFAKSRILCRDSEHISEL